MGWFEGQTTKEKKAAVMNVVAVMTADGRADQRELAHLTKVCNRVGLSQKDLKSILATPGKVKFTVPKSQQERALQLIDMIFMMMADGEIDRREMDVCMTIATRLGFPPSVVPTVLKTIVAGIQKGIGRAQVSVDVGSYLGK